MTMNKGVDPDEALVKAKKSPIGASLVGKNVMTDYGQGVVLEFRASDEIYKINMSQNKSEEDNGSLSLLYTKQHPVRVKTAAEEAEELNIAYVALEKMRRLNLEMECFEHGVTHVEYDHCTTCLLHSKSSQERNRFPRLQKFVDSAVATAESASTSMENTNSFPRLRKLWGSTPATSESTRAEGEKKPTAKKTVVLPRIQKLMNDRQKASASPCLICANPVCAEHCSSSFRKEGITLCLGCERLFELDFIVECVSTPDPALRAKRIDHMVDCYDRCLLLLRYSARYADQIAASLEQQKEQQNKIGLGSSGVGVISGVLGIAAAATILTPAGPPLLIASLFFGGSATAVQTGTEAFNYFSEPNKLADRVIALHGMVMSILRVTSTLRDAMMRDHIRTDVYEAEPSSLTDAVQDTIERNKAGVLAASNVGRAATLGSVAGVEAGAASVITAEAAAATGAKGATALSRAGTAAARTIRFARFAGGALSAAVLVLEANAIQSTLQDISNGNPCDKADRIRAMAEEVKTEQLPSTSELDEECQAYLTALANRPLPEPEVVAVAAASDVGHEFPQAECAMAPVEHPAIGEDVGGALILDGHEPPVAVAAPSASQNTNSFLGAGSSFLQRVAFPNTPARANSSRADEIVAVSTEDPIAARDQELSLVL